MTPERLTDSDVEAIAQRVVQIMGTRLNAPELPPKPPPAPPPVKEVTMKPKLAYSLAELAEELGFEIPVAFCHDMLGTQGLHCRGYFLNRLRHWSSPLKIWDQVQSRNLYGSASGASVPVSVGFARAGFGGFTGFTEHP